MTGTGPLPRRRLSLWQRLGRSNRLFPRKLRMTREGRWFLLITLGIGFAAVNTGNNLMYLVLGLLLSLLVVSGILSDITLRQIEVRRDYPDHLSAESEGLLRVWVRNGKRILPSFSLEVAEVLDYGGYQQVSAYVLHLAPGAEAVAFLRLRFERRGDYESVGLALSTRFPFSFFRKTRFLAVPVRLLVHPPVREVDAPALPPRREGAERTRPQVGRGEEVYGVKDFRMGDALRDVHWKLSARRGRLIAREYERPSTRAVWLAYPNAAIGPAQALQLEAGIVHVASLAARLLERGYRVGLVTLDGHVPVGSGARHRAQLLGHLARLSAHPLPIEVAAGRLRPPTGGADSIMVRPPAGGGALPAIPLAAGDAHGV